MNKRVSRISKSQYDKLNTIFESIVEKQPTNEGMFSGMGHVWDNLVNRDPAVKRTDRVQEEYIQGFISDLYRDLKTEMDAGIVTVDAPPPGSTRAKLSVGQWIKTIWIPKYMKKVKIPDRFLPVMDDLYNKIQLEYGKKGGTDAVRQLAALCFQAARTPEASGTSADGSTEPKTSADPVETVERAANKLSEIWKYVSDTKKSQIKDWMKSKIIL